jgi:UDP-4-amino-4,6-dideoxy-N-acetyl-beta-L-altrosamine transaminase
VIPYGRQDISKEDIDAVIDVLHSDYLTQGPTIPRFEDAVASYCGSAFGVAVNSATSALHIACMALGLGKNDWLWTSPNTFVASANCALYCGAKVDFVDIDPRTYNLCPKLLEKKLLNAENEGILPKVVVPVHFAGQSCEMDKIYALSQKFGFKIIEDASHAIGSSFNRKKIGSCEYSDITVFSFHPVKIITSGEGGMAMTNNQVLAEKMQRFRVHGITTDKSLMHHRSVEEIWNYQQIELGFNYRMTDIHAALGLSQLERLDEFVGRRNEIAKRYNQELQTLPILTPWQLPQSYSSYHLYPIRINRENKSITQKDVYEKLRAHDILVNVHYIPVHRHPYFESMGFKVGDFPESEKFHQEVISLPMFSALNNSGQDQVISTLLKIIKG